MNVDCSGLRVLITAGAGGIGRVTAETFLGLGAKVHICDVDRAALQDAEAANPGLGATLCDVAEPDQVDALFAAATAQLGGLDVLVNNAGIAGPTKPIEDIEPDEFARTLTVNVTGQYLCARRAVPLLRQAGGGAIVNLSSAAGLFGFPLRTPYAASKWAVIGLSKSLALELGGDGIRVNAICPGIVEGPRIDAVIAARASARGLDQATVRARMLDQTALHSTVSQQDIADMICYLCSESGSRISGQAIAVDAGIESIRG